METPTRTMFDAAPDPDLARRNWQMLTQSAPRDLMNRIEDIRSLVFILGLSWPLARFVLTFPDRTLDWFGRHRAVSGAGPRKGRSAPQTLDPRLVSSDLTELRFLRQELTLGILVSDLVGRLDQEGAESRLSELADAIVLRVLDLHQESREGSFFVMAMGKYGGKEMTYESDVDLILLHEDAEPEVVIRSAQSFVKDLSHTAMEGVLYAVDPDLRPHGQAGVLVISVAGFLKYQRESAALWERQALLKARFSGHDSRSRKLATALGRLVYARRSERETLRAVHEMKTLIEKNYAPLGGAFTDLKSGQGGIVDIEFTAQAGQLVAGYDSPDLQTTSTRAALKGLSKIGWISSTELEKLNHSYDTLKRVQGLLRLLEGRPTSQISPSSAGYESLDRAWRWKNPKTEPGDLLKVVKELMQSTRQIYESKVAVK